MHVRLSIAAQTFAYSLAGAVREAKALSQTASIRGGHRPNLSTMQDADVVDDRIACLHHHRDFRRNVGLAPLLDRLGEAFEL